MSDNVNMFEVASKERFRFNTPKGNITTEDLWDLPLDSKTGAVCLNNIAKSINRQIREREEEDFVGTSSKADRELILKLEIVKHVISIRKAESEAKKDAVKRKEQKEAILRILEDKEQESLKGKSPEELRKLLEEL